MPTSTTTGNIAPSTENVAGLRQVLFDGFDGGSLDRSNWGTVYEGGNLYHNGAFRWAPGELAVGNGKLTIGLDKGHDGIWNTSGVSTAPWAGAPGGTGCSITYGRVEIRAKVSQELDGTGPVFLLWPTPPHTWPPEIDILETPRGDGMSTVHWAGASGEDQYRPHQFDIDYSQWHTYTTDWTPGKISFYVDGSLIHTVTQHVPSIPMSVAVQGNVGAASEQWYGGSPNHSGVNHVDIQVDYVSMAQWTGGTLAPPTASASAPPSSPAGAAAVTLGDGPDRLVLKISEDASQGDARYVVKVDGHQIGGTLTAKAHHATGQSDTVTLRGNWAGGSHRVEMTFLNDAWNGTGSDRNLYLDTASYNGHAIATADLDFRQSGTQSFSFTDTAPAAAAATGGIQTGTSGADLFHFTDTAGDRVIDDFESGQDRLVFQGVDPSTVRITADHDDASHAWGQRVSFGTHGESVLLRWNWGVSTADMTFN
ncbi:Family 16 glycosylhydrolase [Rhodovastum atsumiense]|uniref:Family 16 glycosylhydrolase n=1 Tax=Rhodovastum atsumiense TaxID=504468 RepID=A0A5M6IUV6_9PROT|nr:family 16 glycosylhydrolase [Rhodovastum atsumiense]KAA5612011.1 family 16 glycosylhydrolase [Rhodovastum atsumiense]CAH2604129.1 Family 16 glycosylhydrolase [Rhodovastum atsumiense]